MLLPASWPSQVSRFGISFVDLDNLLRAEGLRDSGIRQALINLHTYLRDSTACLTGMLKRQ